MSPSSIDTLMAALDRYAGILQTLDDPARQMGPQIVWTEPDDLATVEALERASGFPLPGDLTAFYLAHGGIDVGQGWGALSLFSAERLLANTTQASPERYPLRHGLLDFIHGVWEGRPEFDEAFSAEQTAQLNRAYLVIGMTALDDDTHRYLFLDRAGRCGALWFNQDCIDDEHLETLHQMLQTSPARSDFCTALAAEVQVAIERLHPRHVTVRA
ncbi:MAG: SMI1/KNR4 family protein [Hydrogenophaga sp.]|nr:SMI1/KNR4 family protein [Hydrogenophaga sp.]